MNKKIIISLIILIIIISGVTILIINNNKKINNKDTNIEEKTMNEFTSKIRLTINNETFTATLEDNETSREFLNKLPLTITMNELNGNEKYYYFDSLPSNSKKVGKINTGDIMLYSDNCLVLFYDTFNTSYTYTKIGKLDNPSNLKDIVGTGKIEISIEKE